MPTKRPMASLAKMSELRAHEAKKIFFQYWWPAEKAVLMAQVTAKHTFTSRVTAYMKKMIFSRWKLQRQKGNKNLNTAIQPAQLPFIVIRNSTGQARQGSQLKYNMGAILITNLPRLHQLDEQVRKLAEKGFLLQQYSEKYRLMANSQMMLNIPKMAMQIWVEEQQSCAMVSGAVSWQYMEETEVWQMGMVRKVLKEIISRLMKYSSLFLRKSLSSTDLFIFSIFLWQVWKPTAMSTIWIIMMKVKRGTRKILMLLVSIRGKKFMYFSTLPKQSNPKELYLMSPLLWQPMNCRLSMMMKNMYRFMLSQYQSTLTSLLTSYMVKSNHFCFNLLDDYFYSLYIQKYTDFQNIQQVITIQYPPLIVFHLQLESPIQPVQALQQLVRIVMFLQEFDDSVTHHPHKLKKAKKEYSAGFKNYHPDKHRPNQSSAENTQAQSDIFDQLKIGNLKQLYLQQQPRANTHQQIIQAQQKSIKRLISKPEKKQEQQTHSELDHQKEAPNRHKFLEVYQRVQHYQDAANSTLLKAQIKRIQQGLKEKFRQRSKKDDYATSFIRFIALHHKRMGQQRVTNDQLLLQYSNFLNKTIKNEQQFLSSPFKRSQLDAFFRKNIYLYTKFDIGKAQEEELTSDSLIKLVRSDRQIEQLSNDAHALQLLNKKYTVPYQSQLYKESKSSIIDQIDNKSQPKQQKFLFNANPVPKSTYQKPKERPKSAQKTKTIVEPFHLTDKGKNQQKMEDYYKWDRAFHARQVPTTTYHAYRVNTVDQADKKRRMTELLRSAAFPSSMNYLQDYNKHMQEKTIQLHQKYAKTHNLQVTGGTIPNFNELHKHQVARLQNRKSLNRHLTTPQPFHLSQSKPRKERQAPVTNQVPLHDYSQAVRPQKQGRRIQPQSTLKFEAYVSMRKKQKEERQFRKMQSKKKEEKLCAEKEVYKEILKQRMGYELHNIPKTAVNAQPLSSNTIKVNLEKIYNVQPLLIERQGMKSKKRGVQEKKSWQPII